MSKTIKKKFFNHLTFIKMLDAHKRASIGKRKKREVISFEMDLETNIVKIMNDIKNHKYCFGKYREFKIYEPKERIIKSLPYRDRIVHQWYIEEFIKPFFYQRFIKDTYACIDNRGTHKAVIKLQKYMRKMKKKYGEYYVLKCDIKKYFYSIDKNILIDILKKNISDKELLNFTKLILGNVDELGIPIGNYTSQYFANIYLNEFDHYVKEVLNIKYYVRYMDDFVFLIKDKQEALNLKKHVELYLKSNLLLYLNKKSKYFPSNFGIDFCGYKIFETHILLRKRFKNKIKKQIKKWEILKLRNQLDEKKMILSLNSMRAHASHSNSFNFMNMIEQKILK